MQPAPQNRHRLSLVSSGHHEGSLSEEAVSGKPAVEDPQTQVYIISGEPALLPGPETEAVELAVVKGRWLWERYPYHHSQSLHVSPDSSHEDISRPCQAPRNVPYAPSWAPGPSPRASELDQPPLPEAPSRRQKLRGCTVWTVCQMASPYVRMPIPSALPQSNCSEPVFGMPLDRLLPLSARPLFFFNPTFKVACFQVLLVLG